MIAIGMIHLVTKLWRGDLRSWLRLTLGAAFLLLGWLGGDLPLLAVEAIVLAGIASQTALELRVLYVPKGVHHARPVEEVTPMAGVLTAARHEVSPEPAQEPAQEPVNGSSVSRSATT
jgi:hypothetical protein